LETIVVAGAHRALPNQALHLTVGRLRHPPAGERRGGQAVQQVSDGTLTAFWITFPEDVGFPAGLGVTAWSEADAFRLLEEKGYDFHLRAKEVRLERDVAVESLASHVRAQMGPVVARGIWFPCFNIGFGAPGAG
jgi:hypothetical protein